MDRLIDESPQWLVAVGKKEKAADVLRKIASYNKAGYKQTVKMLTEQQREDDDDQEKGGASISDVWKTFLRKPRLLMYFAINVFTW